jgi:hypothetical protein
MTAKTKTRASLGFSAQAAARQEPASVKTPQSASREGKAAIPFWVPVSARQQLKHLATDLHATAQDCLSEALNDFFIKHGKPPIA